jgi:hypothetical protein
MFRIVLLGVVLALAGCGQASSGGAEDEDAATGGGLGGGGGGADAGDGPPLACGDLLPAECAARADCVMSGERCVTPDEAACADLGADACAARADCAARHDVFGGFVECRDVGDVPCGELDEGRCGGRDDCAWDGSKCGAPAPVCADLGDAAACSRAACHWWQDACHDGPEPPRCSEPDQASCEAAGCHWNGTRCREPAPPPPSCDELAEGACHARHECRWTGRVCEADPQEAPCADLGRNFCAERNSCAWDPVDAVCIDRPEGRCESLEEQACRSRPDCAPQYEPGTTCGAASARKAAEACPPRFTGCGPAVVDCTAVPVAACAQTPGCRLVTTDCDRPPCAQTCAAE